MIKKKKLKMNFLKNLNKILLEEYAKKNSIEMILKKKIF